MIRRLLLYVIIILSIFTYYLNNNVKYMKNEVVNLRKEIKVLQEKQQIQQSVVNELKNKKVLTYDDIKSLEKIVESEAGGEPLQGKALVANVVLNRWLKTNKSIKEIIYQPKQFSSVALGRYKKAIPSEETKQAVQLALKYDYSRGAEYFINPKIADRSSLRWFRNNLIKTIKYGQHTFYKK